MAADPQREGFSLQVGETGEFPPCVLKAVAKVTTFSSRSLWDRLVDIHAIFLLLRQKRSTSCGVCQARAQKPTYKALSTTVLVPTDISW